MISQEEFGAFVAEFEGFRDSILDLIVELRKEVESIHVEIEKLQDSRSSSFNSSQRRLG